MSTKRKKPRAAAPKSAPPASDAPAAPKPPETPSTPAPGVPAPSSTVPPVDASAPQPATADELVSPLVAGMPTPTDSPLAADPTGKTADPSAPQIGQVDTAGVVFDPQKHAVDETGRPKTDVNGRFYSNKAGRRKGDPRLKQPRAAGATQPPPPGSEPEFTVVDDAPPSGGSPGSVPSGSAPDRFDHAAELYCRTFYGMTTGAFSDDGWQPENEAEHVGLKTSVAAYLRAKQSDDLPPGVILGMAFAAYAGKRISRPKTKERLAVLWMRVKGLLNRGPKAPKNPEPERDGES